MYFDKFLNFLGIKVDFLEREEAAIIFLERKVEFIWQPQIVDVKIRSNVVNFEDFKKEKRKI